MRSSKLIRLDSPAASQTMWVVCLARRAGELNTVSGRISCFCRWAPTLGAAFNPRLLRGRSKSFKPGSSQLDLACRSRYKVFICGWLSDVRAEYLTSGASAQSYANIVGMALMPLQCAEVCDLPL